MKRILPFILIILAVFALAHYFIYQIVSRSINSPNANFAFIIVLSVGLLAIPAGFFVSKTRNEKLYFISWIGFIWMGLFNFLFFFSLAEIALFALTEQALSYWVIWATAIVGAWSLFKGLSSPKIVTHYIPNENLKGLKLVQISDLHVGMLHLNEVWLAKIVERINRVNPHIVAITGDLVEGEYLEITPKLEVLKQLTPKSEKFYITGNHEYINGSGPWENKMSELGFTTLHNENKVVNYNQARVLIAGVPDRMISRFIRNKNSSPDVALKTEHPVHYKILLAHQPASVFDIKTSHCNLVLSGHTHGGQIFPFHFFVRLVQPVLKGFKTINGIKVFAHQGTGLWGPPMRWFSRNEIVLIEWV
ncbi:metallophosphoesterase [bacterium]|nr:metallophosphoesterase [bacterium]